MSMRWVHKPYISKWITLSSVISDPLLKIDEQFTVSKEIQGIQEHKIRQWILTWSTSADGPKQTYTRAIKRLIMRLIMQYYSHEYLFFRVGCITHQFCLEHSITRRTCSCPAAALHHCAAIDSNSWSLYKSTFIVLPRYAPRCLGHPDVLSHDVMLSTMRHYWNRMLINRTQAKSSSVIHMLVLQCHMYVTYTPAMLVLLCSFVLQFQQ